MPRTTPGNPWWKRPKFWGFIALLMLIWYAPILAKVAKHLSSSPGEPIDSLNRVVVYHNANTDDVLGRNMAPDGYNLGLKYQCVEFVKRYYYQHLHHKMPNSYGHAKDFFRDDVLDGQKNHERNLIQYTQPSQTQPAENDLLVFGATSTNPYGHVAIVANVSDNKIEIIQQNAPPWIGTRANLGLKVNNGLWSIRDPKVLGWLRKEDAASTPK